MENDWWGYDQYLESWVFLDRSVEANMPNNAGLNRYFIVCNNKSVIEVNIDDWNEPRFIFEKRVPAVIPNLDIQEPAGYKLTKMSLE